MEENLMAKQGMSCMLLDEISLYIIRIKAQMSRKLRKL
jgi:hypothetical protein